ncbi:frag1/DRAM/Sfk1 family domain-containing protein [Ditylenchus destructor]|nr:frag1/DRAM/Sfk1 family domain-containing protein [Ditylenchus destructor]
MASNPHISHTLDSCTTTLGVQQVKVPRNKQENRILKEGFEEDDNEDIAYLNFRIIWPVGITTIVSVGFFILAFATMEVLEHLAFERFALNQLLFLYGKTRGFCNNTFPYEKGMMPSFLRQVEMKVLTNVFFRVAVCVPMAMRIFIALVIRNSTRDHPLTKKNVFFLYFNEIAIIAAVSETLSLGLFSIVTIRFDYPKFYDLMFGVFVVSATAYMFLRTILSFVPEDNAAIDQIAVIIRLVSTVLFTWTASQVFHVHQKFIHETGCHGYVHPKDAITEYVALVSYLAFHLTQLVDIRDVRFICYPRTSSGECEPLRPENFDRNRPDAKYYHSRAYELHQRQIIQKMN